MRVVELELGPRRFALAMPDVALADEKAREWGECVWTANALFRAACVRPCFLAPAPNWTQERMVA